MLEQGKGNEKAFKSVILAPRNTQRAIELAFYHIGRDHMAELSRQMLKKDKKGRTYIRRIKGGARRRHVASAPGQTAANRTGNMRRSRTFQLQGSDQMEFGIKGAPYAAFLERGTRKMAARPSLGNTVKAQRKNANNAFEFNLQRELT